MIRSGWVALAGVLLLTACATPPRRPEAVDAAALIAQAERERALDRQPSWQFEARVAVRNGDDGGSGQLDWRQSADAVEIALRAPVSGQGWRLRIAGSGARLDGLEGGPRHAADADRLLREAVGWDLPLTLLTRWLRGQRGGVDARLSFDADGLPASLNESGWRIDYRGWDHQQVPPLPRRIEAESGQRRIRLLIRRWQVGADG